MSAERFWRKLLENIRLKKYFPRNCVEVIYRTCTTFKRARRLAQWIVTRKDFAFALRRDVRFARRENRCASQEERNRETKGLGSRTSVGYEWTRARHETAGPFVRVEGDRSGGAVRDSGFRVRLCRNIQWAFSCRTVDAPHRRCTHSRTYIRDLDIHASTW